MLVCFDLDGVLVDACDWHKEALERAMEDILGYHISEEEHKTKFNGLPTRKKLEMLGVSESDTNLVFDLKQKYTIDTINRKCTIDYDKIGMMSWLKLQKHDIACVTNSITLTASLMLEKLKLKSYIDLLVTNEGVSNPKPHPEGYVQAMVHFASPPNSTIILEDSPHGITAAKLTGAKVIEIPNAKSVTLSTIYHLL